jgi:DNA processing protein
MDENVPHEAQEIILSNMSLQPVLVDELIRTCNLSIPTAQTILLELELAGRVKRHHGNKVSLLQD